jgi:hypothetical protein
MNVKHVEAAAIQVLYGAAEDVKTGRYVSVKTDRDIRFALDTLRSLCGEVDER